MRRELKELMESLHHLKLSDSTQTLRLHNILLTIIKKLDQALPIDKSDDD